jgi:hypothetical protein
MKDNHLFVLALCAFAVGFAAFNWSNMPTHGQPAAVVSGSRAEPPPASEAGPRPAIREASDPAHVVLMRFIADLDDILDKIHDPASFEAAKPKLLARTRRHADWASSQQGQGMAQLSGQAAKEFHAAGDRHTRSMMRAERVAPGVQGFFTRELGPLLEKK